MNKIFNSNIDNDENTSGIRSVLSYSFIFDLFQWLIGYNNLKRRFIREFVMPSNNAKILDLGCGYGAVGIAISRAFPESQVLMSDINERAVQISQENARLNKSNAKAVKSDVFENLHRAFDCILLNPPQSAGKNLCFRMIEESFEHLNAGGSFQLVARHKKGGRTLSEKMHEVFGNCKAIAKSKGFRIYYSEKERE